MYLQWLNEQPNTQVAGSAPCCHILRSLSTLEALRGRDTGFDCGMPTGIPGSKPGYGSGRK